MALVPIRVDRTSKPPIGTPLRSDGHWSVQGLVGAWAFNEGGGKTVFNAVTMEGNALPATWKWKPDGIKLGASYQVSQINTNLRGFSGGTASNWLVTLSSPAVVNDVYFSTTEGGGQFILTVNGGKYMLVFRGDMIFDTGIYAVNNIPVSVVKTGGVWSLYHNGLVYNTSSINKDASGNLMIGHEYNYTNGAPKDYQYFQAYLKSFTPQQIASLSANPWQIYDPETVWIEVGGGGEAALFSGSVYGQSSASANLSTAVVLAAAAQGSSTAQAALSTALELAAQVNGIGSATGEFGADISGLAGSLHGSSEAQATLSTAIHLMGLAAGQCGIVGRLAEPVEILAQLRVMASDPLALTISVRDPLALKVTVQ